MKAAEHERRDWIIVFIVLLIGLILVLVAVDRAIRFAPSWKLDASMESRFDPDSEYLTSIPSGVIVEQVDAAILTVPAWFDVFLTPGAEIPTRGPVTSMPAPLSTATLTTPNTATPTPVVTATSTNTPVYLPVTQTSNPATVVSTSTSTTTPTSTSTVTPTSTATPTPTQTPMPRADLQLTKSDDVEVYSAGGVLTYTIVVLNKGPDGVSGAVLTDNIPAQIKNWTWVCASQTAGASGCNGGSSSANFTDIIDLPVNASITYTVTAYVSNTATGILENRAIISVPAAQVDPVPDNNEDFDANAPGVDLQITKTDGDDVMTYLPGGTLTYTIVVTNNSAFNINDAVVTDKFSAQIESASWTCLPGAGAACTLTGTGDINDVVDIPAGISITYKVTANVSIYAIGLLENIASVDAPAGFMETKPVDNEAKDVDTDTEPDEGPPDYVFVSIMPGTSLTMHLGTAIVADGDVGAPDFVFYERLRAAAMSVDLDTVQIEISQDGSTWYQVFYWADPAGVADTNTNVDVGKLIGDVCPIEIDNCSIPAGRLYRLSGITIDIDSLVPPGSYPWVRVIAPPSADASELDAIQPYYP